MAKASDNLFPKVKIGLAGTVPSAPSDSSWSLYSMSDGVYARSSNTSVGPFGTGGGGSVATDAIWDAAGDLAVGSGANTAARLAIGATNGMALRRVSGSVAWDLPPGHEYDYTQKTSATAVTATSEATANTVITAGAVTFDGSTAVIIEFYAPTAYSDNVASVDMYFWLYDGSSSIGLVYAIRSETTNRAFQGIYLRHRLTPSAASHTYSIRASLSSAGDGSVDGGAGGAATSMPCFIRITKA